MASYKQTVLDIKDYISFATADIERLLERDDIPYTQKQVMLAEAQTLKDILDIIKENGK